MAEGKLFAHNHSLTSFFFFWWTKRNNFLV
jgi:hypothetical protein